MARDRTQSVAYTCKERGNQQNGHPWGKAPETGLWKWLGRLGLGCAYRTSGREDEPAAREAILAEKCFDIHTGGDLKVLLNVKCRTCARPVVDLTKKCLI